VEFLWQFSRPAAFTQTPHRCNSRFYHIHTSSIPSYSFINEFVTHSSRLWYLQMQIRLWFIQNIKRIVWIPSSKFDALCSHRSTCSLLSRVLWTNQTSWVRLLVNLRNHLKGNRLRPRIPSHPVLIRNGFFS
jgi:hypothetical protein